MNWLVRFLAWATVLAVPSWWIGGAYHRLLALASMTLLGLPSAGPVLLAPDVPASHALGVYSSMCLASLRTPRQRRLAALGAGLIILMAVELLTGMLAMRWEMSAAALSPPIPVLRLREHLTALPAWIGAPVVWLLLMGRLEFPTAAPPARRPARSRAGTKTN